MRVLFLTVLLSLAACEKPDPKTATEDIRRALVADLQACVDKSESRAEYDMCANKVEACAVSAPTLPVYIACAGLTK